MSLGELIEFLLTRAKTDRDAGRVRAAEMMEEAARLLTEERIECS